MLVDEVLFRHGQIGRLVDKAAVLGKAMKVKRTLSTTSAAGRDAYSRSRTRCHVGTRAA